MPSSSRRPGAAQPLVSVVIPSYNHAAFVLEAVGSVLSQTVSELELLVIDDGSTDGSAELIKRYVANRRRGPKSATVELVARANRGLCATLNEGLVRARGKLFAYLGSDDRWEPTKLERQVEILESAAPRVGAVYSDCFVMDDKGRRTDRFGRQYPFRGGDLYEPLLHMRFHPPSPTNLFDRERLLRAGGFNEAIPIEDRDVWLRMARLYDIAYVDEPLASFRVHESNTSTSHPDKMLRANLQTLDWVFATDPRQSARRRGILAHLQAGLGSIYYNSGQPERALDEVRAALRIWPFDGAAWRLGARAGIGALAETTTIGRTARDFLRDRWRAHRHARLAADAGGTAD